MSCAPSLLASGSEALLASGVAEGLPAFWLDAAVLASTNGSADVALAAAEPPITVFGAAAAVAAGGVLMIVLVMTAAATGCAWTLVAAAAATGVGRTAAVILLPLSEAGFVVASAVAALAVASVTIVAALPAKASSAVPVRRCRSVRPCRPDWPSRSGSRLDLLLRLSLRRDVAVFVAPAGACGSASRSGPCRCRRRSRHCRDGWRISPRIDRAPRTCVGRPVAALAADWWCPERLRRRRAGPQRGRHHCPGRCLGSPPAFAAMAKARLRAWH